jgi:hypothetical protein
MITMTMTAPTLPTSRFPHTARVASSHESTSIVIMHDTNTATFLRASGCVRREPVIDLTMMMWVSRSARAIHSPSFLLPLPCMVPCCESVRTRTTLSIPSYFFQTPGYPLDCCHRGRAQFPISRLAPRTPARHALEDALPLLSNSLLNLAHIPLHIFISVLYMSFIRKAGVLESYVTRGS